MKPLIATATLASIDARETAIDSIVQIMSRAMASLSAHLRTRRLRNDLRKLDNHMLNDIGLTRFDVEFGRLTTMSAKGHPGNV